MNTTTTNNEHCIKTCNSLLRGELSAVETYNQAIEKFSEKNDCSELVRIRDEHAYAVGKLRANVTEMGGTPDTDSGAWGNFAKSVQGAANLFGEDSGLKALQQGEEHGQSDYQDALDDDEVLPACKQLIQTELLPKVNEHIAALKRLES